MSLVLRSEWTWDIFGNGVEVNYFTDRRTIKQLINSDCSLVFRYSEVKCFLIFQDILSSFSLILFLKQQNYYIKEEQVSYFCILHEIIIVAFLRVPHISLSSL